jgi:hypothetical protein
MQKKPWKLIAHIPGLDGKLGSQEYFIVREINQYNAVATLLRVRRDLVQSPIVVKGEAGQGFLDWLQPDRDVFQVMVVS